MTVTLTTCDGTQAALPQNEIDAFAASLSGGIHLPSSREFHESCAIWNGMIERRPGLVVRCSSAGDVSHAVRFARRHDLLVSVRGGGHNIAGNALCDGGIMLDLSPMKSVDVDPVARTARVGGGATLADVDRACQAHGSGDAPRHQLHYRGGGPHARRRLRLAEPALRPHHRQPALRRGRPRQRQRGARERA